MRGVGMGRMGMKWEKWEWNGRSGNGSHRNGMAGGEWEEWE